MKELREKAPFRYSEEFLAKYKNRKPPFGELGWVTVQRTYARQKPDGTFEEWWEICRRVLEGNYELTPYEEVSIEERELAYDAMFNLAWTPPGRGLWMSGTDYARKRGGDALVNCWFVSVVPQDGRVSYPFHFMLDLSMKGGGVGFSVEKHNLDQIPHVRNKVHLEIVARKNHPDFKEMEAIGVKPRQSWHLGRSFKIEDSREGWGHALSLVIDAHYQGHETLIIDLSDIREKGTPIKGFGGTSSGPEPLARLLFDVNRLLNDRVGKKLSSVDATTIQNLNGRTVVAGNVRRTAQIGLSDLDDTPFMQMKMRDPNDPEKNAKIDDHRWASNNTVINDGPVDMIPDHKYLEIALYNSREGEPGIFNRYIARRYGRIIDGPGYINADWDYTGIQALTEDMLKQGIVDNAVGLNPCGEVTLEDCEPCNVVEVFPYMVKKQGYNIYDILTIAVKYAKRVTCARYEWPKSQEVVERNRRIGISLSGIQDWVQTYYPEFYERDIHRSMEDLIENGFSLGNDLSAMYKHIRRVDKAFSKELGINESIKVTTVKPSGTVSKIAGVSEGIHAWYAPYMIRRMRIQANVPLVDLLKRCGFRIEPDFYVNPPGFKEKYAVMKTDERGLERLVGWKGDLSEWRENGVQTLVVEFPVKAPAADSPSFRSADDLTVEEQLKFQAIMQTWWADNSVSATITFKEHEIVELPRLLKKYLPYLKSTSLLPHNASEYEQVPIEPISKEEYEERIKEIIAWPEEMGMAVTAVGDLLDDAECVGGACPIR